MRSMEELLEEARALSPRERQEMAESLLQSLQPISPEIETAWLEEAHRRLEEYLSGAVQAIPGDEVFAEAERRLQFPNK